MIQHVRGWLWKYRITVGAIVVLTILNLAWLGDRWILKYPGIRLIEGAAQSDRLPYGSHVILVEITRGEYETVFSNSSPLDACRLWEAVENIRAKSGLKLVAVDIDTSDERFAEAKTKSCSSHAPTPPEAEPRVIWARGLRYQDGVRVPLGFLGKSVAGDDPSAGIAAFDRDPDATIRNVAARLNVTMKGEGTGSMREGPMRTFPFAIFAADQPDRAERMREIEVRLIPYRFPTLSLIEAKSAPDVVFKGKIVILGGSYLDSDRHFTPRGEMSGLQVVGSAVESLIEARDQSWIHETVATMFHLLADILLALLIVLIYHRKLSWLRVPANWLGVARLGVSILICAIALFGGGVLAYKWGWDGNPFPVVFGMVLHQMWESAHPGEKEKGSKP